MISPQTLQTVLTENQPFYFDLLRRMVEINSFTTNPAGIDALARETAVIFANLGFTAEMIPAANPAFGHHLVLTRLANSEGAPTIGLVSHLDTVFPAEEEKRNQFRWRPEGDRLYGPGTVDIKGGTVMIYMVLDALQQLDRHIYETTNWIILLDAAEEVNGTHFGQLVKERLDNSSRACLIFEGGSLHNTAFQIVVARKGMAVYEIVTEGRAAHSGASHPRGANAILQMADVLQRVGQMTDYQRHLTFNVGVVAGGTVVNRVPHRATATVEMRTFDPAVYHEALDGMLALNDLSTIHSVEDGFPCRVIVTVKQRLNPWPRNEATDTLFNIWQEAGADLGFQALPEARGGLSDGNYFWDHVPTLDGLGPAGGNAHCSERSVDGSKDQEFCLASSFVPKAMLNVMGIVHILKQ